MTTLVPSGHFMMTGEHEQHSAIMKITIIIIISFIIIAFIIISPLWTIHDDWKIISFITIAFIPIEIVINKMADEMK